MVQLFKYCGLIAASVGYFTYVLWGMVFPEAQCAGKGVNNLKLLILSTVGAGGVGQKFSPF